MQQPELAKFIFLWKINYSVEKSASMSLFCECEVVGQNSAHWNILKLNLLLRSDTLSSDINKNWASLAKFNLLSTSLHKFLLLFFFKLE